MAEQHMHINETSVGPTIIHHPADNIPASTTVHTADYLSHDSSSKFGDVDDVELIQDFEDYHEDQEDQEDQEVVTLADMEKQMIIRTLDKFRGRRKLAAKELKISERTLYRKIKEYDIEA
jgi:DNA-binding NtrC family response regulator